jgi:hypothetical protein
VNELKHETRSNFAAFCCMSNLPTINLLLSFLSKSPLSRTGYEGMEVKIQ